MTAIIDFLLARPALSHAVLALLIMGGASLILALFRVANGHWIAATLALGFYWGREKRDHETSLGLPMSEAWGSRDGVLWNGRPRVRLTSSGRCPPAS